MHDPLWGITSPMCSVKRESTHMSAQWLLRPFCSVKIFFCPINILLILLKLSHIIYGVEFYNIIIQAHILCSMHFYADFLWHTVYGVCPKSTAKAKILQHTWGKFQIKKKMEEFCKHISDTPLFPWGMNGLLFDSHKYTELCGNEAFNSDSSNNPKTWGQTTWYLSYLLIQFLILIQVYLITDHNVGYEDNWKDNGKILPVVNCWYFCHCA